MVHFLHTADWQIGRQYGQFEPEDAVPLAQARLDAVQAIARQAAELGVDAVLVAGDVFDMQDVADRTIRRLFQAMEPYDGPWVMIAGNHDAALPASVWTRARQLGCVPDTVHLPAAPGVVELPTAGLAVLVAPLTQRHTHDDVTAVWDPVHTPSGMVRVGLAHGSVAGRLPEAADAANPIAPDRAARARLDYLALGDWHGCLKVDERTWYSGTPEQDRYKGNEPGYALHVRIAAPGALPEVTRLPIGRYTWHAWRERIALPGDVEELERRLQALGTADVVQLTLEGALGGAALQTLDEVIGRARARVHALRLEADALRLEPDADDLSGLGAGGYLAEVVAQLQARQDSEVDGGIAREALRLLVRLQRELDAEPGP